MFITKEDLYTHLRGEATELITRGDDTLIAAALDGAIAEARGYLSRYDTEAIFSAEGAMRHALLLIFIKDIAVWHLINLCNCGASYERRESRYNRAVEWLKSVEKGATTPGLPEKPEQAKPAALFSIISNKKRNPHF